MQAKFFSLVEKMNDNPIDILPDITIKQSDYLRSIEKISEQKNQMMEQRRQIPTHITLKEMPQNKRYNKLKTESKLFLNIIKMICYRGETALSEQISPFFARSKEEKRMLIKQIFNTAADLIPDDEKQTLTVILYSLSTPRANFAVEKLCEILNDTQTVFPNTNYKMLFKTTASQTTKGQEF